MDHGQLPPRPAHNHRPLQLRPPLLSLAGAATMSSTILPLVTLLSEVPRLQWCNQCTQCAHCPPTRTASPSTAVRAARGVRDDGATSGACTVDASATISAKPARASSQLPRWSSPSRSCSGSFAAAARSTPSSSRCPAPVSAPTATSGTPPVPAAGTRTGCKARTARTGSCPPSPVAATASASKGG